jgi:hypothetical protein
MNARLARAAWWTAPSLLCLVVYWYGLKSWFFQDDFAWLGLRLIIHNQREFWAALFTPMAQGSVRPLSERGFFLLFEHLFGLNPLPFRIWVFLTQFANLALVAWLAWKLTGSRAVGFWAPILWLVNPALATPMSWTSSYNQILCAFFILSSLSLFIRYVETGERKFYWLQWGTFVLGFGALELNVMYPAIAALYALTCARRYFVRTLPMFAVSAIYTFVHRHFAEVQTSGPYMMHWDSSIFSTLATYLRLVAGLQRVDRLYLEPASIGFSASTVVVFALLAFLLWKLWRREWLALFLAGWFLIVLAPLLPLRDHIIEYYVAIPAIGVAILAAWGLVCGWRAGPLARGLAVLLTIAYLFEATPETRYYTRITFDRSRQARNLVRGVQRARELHPNDLILLKGVGSGAFWGGIVDNPFRLLGITDVYLVPGSDADIESHPDLGDPASFVIPAEAALNALNSNRAVVYEASSDRLRNITELYRYLGPHLWKGSLPPRADAGSFTFADQFGPGWYKIENGYRWMAKRSEMRIAGPTSAEQHVFLKGFASEQLWQPGLNLRVSMEGIYLGTAGVRTPEFEWSCPVPPQLLGHPQVTIVLEADRTYLPPDDLRQLSVAFGSLGIR